MPDLLGITLWIFGIIFIMSFIYILNLLEIKSGDHKFKKQIYLVMALILIFILVRVGLRLYSNNLSTLDLPNEILTEKLLFARIFLQVPFAIAATILLVLSYRYLIEIKQKTKRI